MNRYASIISSLIWILGISLSACSPHEDRDSATGGEIPEEAMRRLNATITRAPEFQNAKEHRLDSLKALLRSGNQPSSQWEVLIEIASQYRQMNADSSMYYAEQAILQTPNDSTDIRFIRSRLALVNALSTAGIFTPAIQTLEGIRHLITPEVSADFWRASRMLYSYRLAFVQDHGKYADIFRRKYIECDDSLLKILPDSDPFRQFIYSERLVTDSRWEQARMRLNEILRVQPKESNIYGMAAFQLAIVNRNMGNHKQYAEMLVLSAESDIKGCIKEGLALPTLANWLYEHGDLDNAFNYINFALQEANSGNIRMRTVTIAAFMPVIDEAYRKQIETSNNRMLSYLLIATTLMLIAIILLVTVIKNVRSSRLKERKLAATSKKLEAYIGNFIGLCSTYSERLDQLSKLVTRKINARQTDDLLKLMASGKFGDEDNDQFYKLVDKAILDIFPDFVQNINALLQADKQIQLKPGETLNPELRIYAFVRLGVDQSSKIAQILHYSSNTVYAYRNRMRNRAIDRENFDSLVANMGSNIASENL